MKGLLALALLSFCEVPALRAAPPSMLRAGGIAPSFTLADVGGHTRSLASFHGRPVALFFFCGCQWCARCARDWGQFQRGGVLSSDFSKVAPPATLVVFSGDAAAAKDFILSTGMDPSQTVLMPDSAMHVTLDLYHAEPCPRVFVIDPQGRVRYTNDHKDDAPRQAPEMVIASRALDALRACEIPAPAPQKPAKQGKGKTKK